VTRLLGARGPGHRSCAFDAALVESGPNSVNADDATRNLVESIKVRRVRGVAADVRG
jgi:hypothetical protein